MSRWLKIDVGWPPVALLARCLIRREALTLGIAPHLGRLCEDSLISKSRISSAQSKPVTRLHATLVTFGSSWYAWPYKNFLETSLFGCYWAESLPFIVSHQVPATRHRKKGVQVGLKRKATTSSLSKHKKEREGVAGDGERVFRVNSKGGPGKK